MPNTTGEEIIPTTTLELVSKTSSYKHEFVQSLGPEAITVFQNIFDMIS